MTRKNERLVNLTIALLETRRPLSFAELRRRTRFYDQPDPEAARRMFERDKADLRALGVPVRTERIAHSEEEGYRIDRRDYELPDLELTAEEITALAAALRVTGSDGSVTLAKLGARAPDPLHDDPPPGLKVSVEPGPAATVAEAVLLRAPVSFGYRPVHGEPATRTVDPYAVVQREGRWYLVGHDHDRADRRVFRLDRMLDTPRIVGPAGSVTAPDDLDLADAVAGPRGGEVTAELAVGIAVRDEVRARGGRETGRLHGERPVLRVDGVDVVRDLPWLLGCGPELEVLAPPELRSRVVAALRSMATEGAS